MDLLNELNDMQAEAVIHTEGPLLLLAGAGSGKTRVITYRMAYLLEQGVSPFNMLAITFTNKAAREMKDRVSKLVLGGSSIWVSTFHSTCLRILRIHADRINFPSEFTIYDTDDSEKLMKQIMRDTGHNEKQLTAKAALGEIGRAKDELIDPVDFAAAAMGDFRLNVIAGLYAEYQKRLFKCGGMDFDDIINNTVKLFRQNPDVLERYQARFQYIMVDEYQDTNTAQYELIRLLAAGHHNLCVVGDDDQSIYGWRGANIRNILDFEKDYKNAETIRLEQNYRSTDVILDAANAVIAHNKGRKGKTLWTDYTGGEPITNYRASSDIEEAAYIAENIIRIVASGGHFYDCACLYRMNAQSRSLEEQLIRRNVPYRIYGGVRFYERREIKDVLAYLRVLVNPYDEVSLTRIVNVPRRGIGGATLDKLTEYARESDIPLFNAMQEIDNYMPGIKGARVKEFCALLNEMRQVAQMYGVVEIIERLLDKTKFTDALLAEGAEEGGERVANVHELISKAAEFEKTAEDRSLAAFLSEVALVADVDAFDGVADAACLMTLHSAKGLEFEVVFIPGFEEGIFPTYRAAAYGTEKEMEEERRLCYVGITRAKRRLFIANAMTRMQHGQVVSNAPSRFLKEIPMELIDDNKNKAKKEAASAHAISPRRAIPVEQREKPFTAAKLPPPTNVAAPDYAVGDNVRQLKYGVGRVTAIDNAGADYEVSVEFPGIGVKKFMAHLSKLQKV